MPKWSREKYNVFAEAKDISKWFTRLRLDAYYQKTIKHMENFVGDYTGGDTVEVDNFARNYLNTTGLSLQTDWQLGSANHLIAGYEFSYDDMDSVNRNYMKMNQMMGMMSVKMDYYRDKLYEGNQMTHALFANMETQLPRDFALTYGEIVAMLDSKGIEIKAVDETYQEASLFGKRFAGSGGVAKAVLEVMEEMGEDTSGIRLMTCAGGDECRKALTLLKNGKLDADFVEGMICPGGCIGGPSKHQAESIVLRAREDLLERADHRKVLENLKQYPMEKFSMQRDGCMENKVNTDC